MSGVKVIRNLLAANAALTAVVSEEKIKAGDIDQGTPLPAIALHEISRVEQKKVGTVGLFLVTSRVQATVMAASYPAKERLIDLTGQAIRDQRGEIQGVTVDSIHRDVVGPDMKDVDAKIYMKTRDFLVKFLEQH